MRSSPACLGLALVMGSAMGCAQEGAPPTPTLEALCAEPAAYVGARVELQAPLREEVQCTAVGCADPYDDCNVCWTSFLLRCEPFEDLRMSAGPDVPWPSVVGDRRLPDGGPRTWFGCVSTGCAPAPADRIRSVTVRVVRAGSGARLEVLDAEVLPE